MNTDLLARLVADNLRPPASLSVDGLVGTASFTWEPPLSTAEQAILDDLTTMAKFGVSLTLAEWQSVKPDAALLRTYNGIASPTLAQTIAATKAQNRILATIIRS